MKQSEQNIKPGGVSSSNFTLKNEDPALYQTMLSNILKH